LSWPDGWPRTKHRERSDFHIDRGFNAARDGAFYQLGRMRNVSHVVITSNLPVTASGKPYTTNQGNIADPGIAVWWIDKGQERVIACDRWLAATENMRAIEKSLEAMRGLDRWGATQIVERAFAGFAALPPPSGPEAPPPSYSDQVRNWREVFSIDPAVERGLGPYQKGSPAAADLFAIVKRRHRELIRGQHPDVGGDAEAAAFLNASLAAAEAELL
jgi:hypothetical protein